MLNVLVICNFLPVLRPLVLQVFFFTLQLFFKSVIVYTLKTVSECEIQIPLRCLEHKYFSSQAHRYVIKA